MNSVRLLKLLGVSLALTLDVSTLNARSPLNLDVLKRDGYGVVTLRHSYAVNRLIADGVVDGRRVYFILDTGFCAPHITMGNASAWLLKVATRPLKGVGYGFSGKPLTNFSQGTASALEIGNVQVTGTPLVFGPFPSLSEDLGFLGLGFLRTCSAIVDLQTCRLYLKAPRTGRTPVLGPALKAMGLCEAGFVEKGNLGLLVDVEINGAKAQMILDTGAALSTVDERFATQAKLRGYRSRVRVFDIAGVESRPDWDEPDSFKVGGADAEPPRFLISPMSFYASTHGKVVGLLGMDFLGQRWGIIDFAQQKVYFAPRRKR